MGRTKVARDVIGKINQNLHKAKSSKEQYSNYLNSLKKRYSEGKISYANYVEELHKKREGRTLNEWIEYLDNYHNKCNNEIKKQKKTVTRKNIFITFISAILLISFFTFFSNNFSFTGFAVSDNFSSEENENFSVSTFQYEAVLGKPVKWVKEINPDVTGKIKVILPGNAENINITKTEISYSENEGVLQNGTSPSHEESPFSEASNASFISSEESNASLASSQESPITGAIIGSTSTNFFGNLFQNFFGTLTGKAVDENSGKQTEVSFNAEEEKIYKIEYETPAPVAEEKEIKNGKEVKINGPDSVHYENVLAFTDLSEGFKVKDSSRIKIYWKEENQYLSPEKVEDTDNDGVYDYIEWVVPHLSEQTFEIIIEVSKAEHLDSEKNFISDIYNDIKSLDDVWSEEISENDYVRVTFEKSLTNRNDITIYPRVVSGNPRIEVYEADKNEKLAEFNPLNSNEYNKIFLTNLSGEQDSFDLKIIGGSVEFDYIVDPWPDFSYNLYENFEDSTLASGITTTGSVTIPSTDYAHGGSASGRVIADAGGNDYFQADVNSANLSLGFWLRTPGGFSEGEGVYLFLDQDSSVEMLHFAFQMLAGEYYLVTTDSGDANMVYTLAQPFTWYWVTYKYSRGNNVTIWIYNESHSRITNYSCAVTNNNLLTLIFGAPYGLSAGTSYYDDLVIDSTNANFPLLGWELNAPPQINFTAPTPDDATTTSNTSILVNVTSNSSLTHSVFLDWNRSLVGWWNFDSRNSTTVFDNSTYGNNGTIYGAIYNSDGARGGAFEFGGAEYINVGRPSSLNLTHTGTVSAWINFTTSVDWPVIVGNGNWATNVNGFVLAGEWVIGKNDPALMISNGATYNVINSTVGGYNDGLWHLVTGTFNGTHLNLYIDGASAASPISQTIDNVGLYNITIGKDPATGTANWTGSIDEVMIWNRALSPREVQALYNATAYQYYNNFTNLSTGTYNYKAYAIDSSGGINSTETRSVTTGTSDAVYPKFSNYQDNNGSLIGSGTGTFNVTLSNTNGTVWLEINGTNVTARNNSGSATVFNATYSFSLGGEYPYKWHSWGNGTNHNYNFSTTQTYSVNHSYSLTITSPTTASPASVNGSDNLSVLFNFMNGVNITSGVSMNNITIGGILSNLTQTYSCSGTLTCSNYASQATCNNCSQCNWTTGGTSTIAKIGTDTNGTNSVATAKNLTFNHVLVAGTNRIIIVSFGVENLASIRDVTYGGVSMTRAVNTTVTSSANNYTSAIYYLLDSNLPSDGTNLINVSITSSSTAIEINAFASEYVNVSQEAPESTAINSSTSATTQNLTNSLTTSTGSWVISSMGCGQPGSGSGYTHENGQTEIRDFADSSSRFAVTELRSASAGTTTLKSNWSAGAFNRDTRVAASFKPATSADSCQAKAGGACSSCAVGECDSNCSTGGCSLSSSPQFVYIAGLGWQVNVTVPNGLTGLQNLFVNATYDGNTANDTETNAVNYGGADSVYPQFSNYQDNNGSLTGSGTGVFNVTVSNTNGTVWLEINGTNVTARNNSGSATVFNATYSFSTNGIYSYKWHSWGNGTNHNYNVSNTQSYTVNASAATAPNITSVQSISATTPSEGTTATVTFNFTAYDVQGASTLNDSTADAYFQRSGQTTRQNLSCYSGASSTNYKNYTCSIAMWYFDQAGAWTINVTINDTSGLYGENASTTFTYNQLTSMVVSPSALGWPTMNLSSVNIGATNNPMIVNNTGNAENLKINVTAYDLRGETTTTQYIPAANFSVDNISSGCFGNVMANATDVRLTNSTLQRGNNSINTNNSTSGQAPLYVCLRGVPQTISSQAYSSGTNSWVIKIFAVAIVVKPRKKKKKNIPENDNLLKAFNLLAEEMKEEYSLNKKELLEIIVEKLKGKYNISKKEIIEATNHEEEIPISIFSTKLGHLEAITKYMKENLGMNYREIGKEIGRDERTVWTSYNKASKKMKGPFNVKEGITIPINIFKNKQLTIFESIVLSLKNKGMKYSEIGTLLNRDQRNIWTVYSRIRLKNDNI